MSDSIGDLLSGNNYSEPPEIKQIKDFVAEQIGLVPRVSITSSAYVITLPSAAAAGTLRTNLFKLQSQLDTKKRLLIRIG